MTSALLLADAVVTGSGESKKSGPIGLAVILLLCVACYFLFKSMSRHLRRVREDFPADGPADGDAAQAVAPREPAPKPVPDATQPDAPQPDATQPENGDDAARAP
ncbi:MAG: hypothetical protein QOK11_3253 [Pseudonocardiales bacterium]|nr:hypothetical protein [Pseudonocardiales bacterium]